MNSSKKLLLALVAATAAQPLFPEELLIESSLSDTYHYVDHYEILIEALPEDVWPVLIDVGSWMNELAMRHESGPPRSEGQIFTLYGDEHYRLEIVKLVPERMMIAANLPSNVDGEDSVGIAVITLSESDDVTVVSNSMIRQYDWSGEGPNPARARRNSDEYRQLNQALWDSMLTRLKQRVEEQ